MGQLGMGVMINMLGSNAESVNAYKESLGKTIERAAMEDDSLRLHFTDGSTLTVHDDGQSCCEHRYMSTDDDLSAFNGAKLDDLELKEAPAGPSEYGEHEVQFLEVRTSKGSFTIATHNEHNGYYGGFYIKCALTKP